MQKRLTSLMVDDRDKALNFYTAVISEDICGDLINLVQPA
jgi:hypothetical protein